MRGGWDSDDGVVRVIMMAVMVVLVAIIMGMDMVVEFGVMRVLVWVRVRV